MIDSPIRRRAAILALAAGVLTGGCGSSTGPGSGATLGASPTAGGSPVASAAAASSGGASAPAPLPSATPAPFPSSLPGLRDWTIISPGSVEIATDGDAITLTLTRRALWFQGQRGVLVGEPVTGDFRISATVRATTRAGDPLVTRTDGLVELGGLMARADNAARENYVFVVVGTDANDLSVETKSTTDSSSRFDGPSWPFASADLRLCRVGPTFTAWKRAAAAAGPWIAAAAFDRPDLPDTVLVGPNVYANGDPDLAVTFTGLRIEPLGGKAACTGD